MDNQLEQALDTLSFDSQPLHEAKHRRIAALACKKIGQQCASENSIRLPESHRKTAQSRFGLRRALTFAAVAAVLACCALTVGAVAGLGQRGNVFPGFWATLFPGTAPSQQVESNIMSTDRSSLTLDGYTFTILNYMIDEAGTGCIYYSVENPGGIGNLFAQYKGSDDPLQTYSGITQTELGGGTHAAYFELSDGTPLLGRTYKDDSTSTDTKWYIFEYFTDPDPMPPNLNQELIFTVYKIRTSDFEPKQEISLTLPPCAPLETIVLRSGDLTAELSPIGLKLMTDQQYFADKVIYLAIELADGTRYVLQDELGGSRDVFGYVCSSANGENLAYAFRRVLELSQPTAVQATVMYADGTHFLVFS